MLNPEIIQLVHVVNQEEARHLGLVQVVQIIHQDKARHLGMVDHPCPQECPQEVGPQVLVRSSPITHSVAEIVSHSSNFKT